MLNWLKLIKCLPFRYKNFKNHLNKEHVKQYKYQKIFSKKNKNNNNTCINYWIMMIILM